MRRSTTYDNGFENAEHLRTNRVWTPVIGSVRPNIAGSVGAVENTISLVSKFFIKKTDFATISKIEILSVERWLNNQPRKCLGFKTPAEVFNAAGIALAG